MARPPLKGRVTGLGGVFFKGRNSEELENWYRTQLGLPADGDGFVVFPWRSREDPPQPGSTVWSVFRHDTTYFEPGGAPFMINYRVDDLDAVLLRLKAAGIAVDEKIQTEPYGRFGWAQDPEGNRFELWEPAEGH